MVLCKPCENLRGFVISQPPLVLFMFTLMCFAGALVGFSIYILDTDIKDPNAKLDWNTYLTYFSDVEFCISAEDDTSNDTAVTGVVPMATRDSMTVTAIVSLNPGKLFRGFTDNVTQIHVNMKASQFGVRGELSNQPVSVLFSLSKRWDPAQCQPQCEDSQILACLTLTGDVAIFPRQTPDHCDVVNYTSLASASVGFVVGVDSGSVIVRNKPMTLSLLSDDWCRQGALLTVYHRINPLFTAMLSMSDRSMVNLHLLHTSYFLFVMVLCCVCYAMIRGRVNTKHNSFSTVHSINTADKNEFDA